ncbi:hypothetical protein NGRA_3205 [Nosema granulosis]|uniref:Uncharacterized protein n=1 Tax=Nosema granulosis TaxID=83296 RepID=A0A9P6KXF8_9MICR|nr:hypothetical protein NGRA_3205 [Nosema granulosis]
MNNLNVEEERQKRANLVKKKKELLKQMNLIIEKNISTISEILTIRNYEKITDWPKKVVLCRLGGWIEQIQQQTEELVKRKLNICKILEKNGALKDGIFKSEVTPIFNNIETHKLSNIGTNKLSNIGTNKLSNIDTNKLSKIGTPFCCEEYEDLLKTEFVYRQLILKANNSLQPSKEDYFLNTSVVFQTGEINFSQKNDNFQTISPKLNLNNFERINKHFQKPLFMRIGINSLKLFAFQSKICLGLLLINRLARLQIEVLEEICFSSNVSKNITCFISDVLDEDYLNEKIEEYLEKLYQNEDQEDYLKVLICYITMLSFPGCKIDLRKWKSSKYFYLLKWAE